MPTSTLQPIARGAAPARVARPGTSRRALRLVAVVALDREEVAACLGVPGGDSSVWPSTLYAWLAEAAAASPVIWSRAAAALDRALGPWLAPHRDATAATIAYRLTAREARALDGREVAGALWALARRSDRSHRLLLDRLASEAEVLVARTSAR